MSEPKSGESDLHEAFVAFSNEVFGATQRLLSAQQQLAQEILSGASRTGTAESGQQAVGDLQDDETDRDGTYEDVDEDVDDAADEPEPGSTVDL